MALNTKQLSRLAVIAKVASKHQLLPFLMGLGFGRHLSAPTGDQAVAQEPAADDTSPADGAEGTPSIPLRVASAMQDLGPTFVKFGQLLSTRPDLVPADYISAFRTLQDAVDPFPGNEAREVVERELGVNVGKAFDAFELKPLASASMAQVHAARLRGGVEVVVKVKRPGIDEQIRDDLDLLDSLAASFTNDKETQQFDFKGTVQQLRRSLTAELDFRAEARSMKTLAGNLREFPSIIVPSVIDDFSSGAVLTMQRIRGIKPGEMSPLTLLEHDFENTMREILHAYLKQICVDGFFHADPHPGNLLLRVPGVVGAEPVPVESPEPEIHEMQPDIVTAFGRISDAVGSMAGRTRVTGVETESRPARHVATEAETPGIQLVLLDCGMTGRLTRRMQDLILQLLFHTADGRGDKAAATVVSMSVVLPHFDRNAFDSWMADLVGVYAQSAIQEMDTGKLLMSITQAGRDHGLQAPAELTLVAKALLNLDEVVIKLAPSLNVKDVVRSFASRMMTLRLRQDLSPSRFFAYAIELNDLIGELPGQLRTVFDRMSHNKFEFRLEVERLTDVMAGLECMGNRITAGLVIAALVVGSSIIAHVGESWNGWRLFGYPGIAVTGFLLASALGVYLAVLALMPARRPAVQDPAARPQPKGE
jgi:predicted unusual protein kinase regulating ubiquinone biosynthesis (AarF/ABC1/UbiB family)